MQDQAETPESEEEKPADVTPELVDEVAAADAEPAPLLRDTYEIDWPVKLAPAARLEVAEELAAKLDELTALEARKSAVSKQLGGEISELEEEIAELNRKFRTGTAEQKIAVYDERDVATGRVTVRRADTNEALKVREMGEEDRQLRFGERPTNHTGDAGADEQSAATPEEAEAMREARIEQERHDRAVDLARTAKLFKGGKRWTAIVDVDGAEVKARGDDEDAAVEALRKKLEKRFAKGGAEDDDEGGDDEPTEKAPRALLKPPPGARRRRHEEPKSLDVEVTDHDGNTRKVDVRAVLEDSSDEDDAAARKAADADEAGEDLAF